MGLLENAAQAKALHDERTKAERIAAGMAAWEAQLAAARAWWTHYIGEPAEFFYPAGEHGVNYRRKGVIAVCDGWSFYVSSEDHRRHANYSKHEPALHAYLITKMETHGDKQYAPVLWCDDSYYSDPYQLDSLAAIGGALAKFTAKGGEPPDPETLIWRKVRWK
jgi:hypothetical protein